MQEQDIQAAVLNILRDRLKNPVLTAEDDFFAAGGDSLLAVEAIHRISEVVGSDVDPMVLFMYSTAATLTPMLDKYVQSGK